MNIQHRAKGYTLVELLIVLAVIAILAALLVPVFARVRAQNRASACRSNLHQIGLALTLYVADADSWYPLALNQSIEEGRASDALSWRELMASYLKSAEFPTCPDVALPGRLTEKAPESAAQNCGYALNYLLSEAAGTPARYDLAGRAETQLRFPATTVTVFDARAPLLAVSQPDTLGPRSVAALLSVRGYDAAVFAAAPGARRHQNGANYLFADGHVRWLTPAAFVSSPANANEERPGFRW